MMKVEPDLSRIMLKDLMFNMLEKLLNNAPNKPSDEIFRSYDKSTEKSIPTGKSIIDAINRYQPSVQTIKITENEWNTLQTNKSLQEANSSFIQFSELQSGKKLDKKYVYLNGGIHVKLDNREPDIIAAVGAFNKKRIDPDFEKRYAEIHFAHDIIIQLNAINNHKNYLIPELLANTSMSPQDKFSKICAYREEITKAYLKISTLLKDTKLPIDKKYKEQMLSIIESDLKNVEKELSNVIPHANQISFLKKEFDNINVMKIKLIDLLTQEPLPIADIAYNIAQINESSDKLIRTSSILSMNIDKTEKTANKDYINLSDSTKDLKKAIKDINIGFIQNAIKIADQHPQNPEKEIFKLLNTFIKNHNDKGVEQLLKNKQLIKVMKEPRYPEHITIVMMENFANHPSTRQLYLHLEKHKPVQQQSITKVLGSLTTPSSTQLTSLSTPTPLSPTIPSQPVSSQPSSQTTSVAPTGAISRRAEEEREKKALRTPQVLNPKPDETTKSGIGLKKS